MPLLDRSLKKVVFGLFNLADASGQCGHTGRSVSEVELRHYPQKLPIDGCGFARLSCVREENAKVGDALRGRSKTRKYNLRKNDPFGPPRSPEIKLVCRDVGVRL